MYEYGGNDYCYTSHVYVHLHLLLRSVLYSSGMNAPNINFLSVCETDRRRRQPAEENTTHDRCMMGKVYNTYILLDAKRISYHTRDERARETELLRNEALLGVHTLWNSLGFTEAQQYSSKQLILLLL